MHKWYLYELYSLRRRLKRNEEPADFPELKITFKLGALIRERNETHFHQPLKNMNISRLSLKSIGQALKYDFGSFFKNFV